MKKAILLFGVFFCVSLYTSAQMDNLVNVSPNWVASPARNAATNSADIVVYNPAATTTMGNGLHVNIGNQSLFRKPTHTYDLGAGEKTVGQTGSDPILPNLYASYTKDSWSFHAGVFVSGGGATLNYASGSLITDLIGYQSLMAAQGAYGEAASQYLKASSYYVTSTIGAAYKFNDIVSASVSMRYLNGMNKTKAGMTLTSSPIDMADMPLALDYQESATAVSGVVGVFVRPTPKMGVSVRYESKAKMDFKTKLIKDDFGMVTDGDKNRRDLPSVLALGFSYKFNHNLTVLTDVNFYNQESADWGTTTNASGETVSLSKTAGNAVTYCLAMDYLVNKKITFSFGGGYTDFKFNDMAAYYTHVGVFETVQNDNVNVNAGCSVQVFKGLTLTGGFMHTAWAKNTKVKALAVSPDTEVTINNSMNAIAFGVDIKF